jgi:hypothetical protein
MHPLVLHPQLAYLPAPKVGEDKCVRRSLYCRPRGPDVEYRYSCTLSLTSALDGGGLSASSPGRFTPRKDSVSIGRRLGGHQG